MTKYLDLGINTIAINENKQAIYPWKRYQTERITAEELERQLADPRAKGVAIICGAISGGLEVIDVDTKYQTYELWQTIKEKIPQGLYGRLHIVKTRSGGYHICYRCEVVEGNAKLALRHASSEEIKANPHNKTLCIIETRGEAGYVVAPPSEGYEVIQDGIHVISIEEREELLSIMRSLNEVIDEEIIEAHNRPSTKEYGLSPFDDYNKRCDFVELMERNGWKKVKNGGSRIFFLRPGGTSEHSGSYNTEMGLFSVFSTNTPFQVSKGYSPSAVFTILECGGDYKKSALSLLNAGYGERKSRYGDKLERDVFEKRSNGVPKEEQLTMLVKKYDKSVDEAKEIIDRLDMEWGENIREFWDSVEKRGRIEAVIKLDRLQRFLTDRGGFKLYFYEPNSIIYRMVRVLDGMVVESSTEQIKKFIKNYINRLPSSFDAGLEPQSLMETIYKGANQYFSDNFFEFFERADLKFLSDKKEEAYIPFSNGVVRVTKDGLSLLEYGSIKEVIWKSQVINHHIYIENDFEYKNVEYYKFIERICDFDTDRIIYAISLIGYLLHKYKDPARPFAVILCEETENEAKGGGTGKGIFNKALGYINRLVVVDGKNFKVDKNFAFQRVDLDTRLLAIEDTRRNVDFEGFYSIITEGITVEKKNKDELRIHYKDSPKVIFTTNYTIPNAGNHAKRRQKVFEFSGYFSPQRTPEDEFGHKLFDDWDKDEWNRFYNFMFHCMIDYLDNGVTEVPPSDKIVRKQIKVQFGEEFLDYFLGLEEESGLVITLERLYNDYLVFAGCEKKDYSLKRFTKGVEESCGLLKIEYETFRDRGNSNKKCYKIYFKPKESNDLF
jgi:hypothetical protein